MQRREGNVIVEMCENAVVDQDWFAEQRAAVNNTMPESDRLDLLFLAQPNASGRERGRNIGYLIASESLINQRVFVGRFGAQPGPRADAIHLPFQPFSRVTCALDLEDLELDAGRTSINDQDRIHRAHAAGKAAIRRRASA